ncbi:MAG: hypothetical protein K2P81_02225 [Bacteriovoracaceae bacterium]|nr:hypothetical protein [Bacteriovoracaceae bacterium]
MKWLTLLFLFSCSTAGPQYRAKAPLKGVAHGFMYFYEEDGVRYYYQFESRKGENWLKMNLFLMNTHKKPKKILAKDFNIEMEGQFIRPVEKKIALDKLEKEIVARKDGKPVAQPEFPVMYSEKDYSTNLVKTLTNELILVDRYMFEEEFTLLYDSSMKTYVLFMPEAKLPESFQLRLTPKGDLINVAREN